MTDIGKINVGQTAYTQLGKTENGKECPVCGDCHKEEISAEETNLNNSPEAVLGQSMIKSKKPYEFDPKNVEEDVKNFQALTESSEENAIFARDFQKGLAESYIQEGMSEEEAEHFANIAAACLMNPTIYNR